MAQIATHPGTVIESRNGIVKVEMHVLSACSSCKGHEKCAFVDKADKTVEVETDEWHQYNTGDKVTVSVNESLGLLAVLLAYFLPAVLMTACVVVLSIITGSELIAALVPIIVTAVYFVILYLCRDKLQRKFTFGLSKQ